MPLMQDYSGVQCTLHLNDVDLIWLNDNTQSTTTSYLLF